MTRRIFLFLVLFGFQSFANEAAQVRYSDLGAVNSRQVLIHQVRLRMAYGLSVWEESFPATGSNPLRILYQKEFSCPRSPRLNVFVRVAGTTTWQPTQLLAGYDYYQGGSIDGLRFEIDQPYFPSMTCTWKIYAENGTAFVEPGQKEELVGALSYTGGFALDVAFPLTPSRVVTEFRLAIPAFCEGVEILEANTVTEGVKDKAQLVDKSENRFAVNQGNGARISNLLISANGPTAKSCQIPIYVKGK